MKFQKEKIFFIIFFLISILIGRFTWGLIELDYQDRGIIGEYSKQNYNSFNDILRYLVFLSLPSLIFIISKYYSNKNFFNQILSFFNTHTEYERKKNIELNLFFFTFIFILLASFFSINFLTNIIDSYHEGQRISSAYKNFLDNSLWSGSYVTVGIFYETLSSSIFWKLFDHISIGITRFADLIYVLIFKLLAVYFIYLLTKFTNLNLYKQIIFFLFNSIVFVSMINYEIGNVSSISFREIPIILLLIFFTFIISKRNSLLFIFLISCLSPLSMFWGIDRGLICNILIFFIFLFLVLSKRYQQSFFLLFFIMIVWASSYFFLEKEFEYFIENTFSIYKEMPYVHGLIHPVPFSDDPNSSRATKTMLAILGCIIISINLIFNKDNPTNFSKIFIFLSLISIGSYLYALGRTDGPHIKNSFGFPLITLSIFFSYFVLKFFKNISKLKFYISSSIMIITLIFLSEINFSNIFNFKKRLNLYVNIEDKEFLNKDEKKLIDFLKPKVKNFDCIQIFSNDAILYYLLQKKSCTKYYFVWSASSKINQKRFINQMEETKIIISGGSKNDWDYPLEEKLYLVNSYINENFNKIDSYKKWNILIRD
ncbi:hypothetical protein IDG86_02215 [Pelagibacterales bacterium SAG-MED13]|nr:hypothetical protein [Pelagibacterales bacterium SAG-MED13]